MFEKIKKVGQPYFKTLALHFTTQKSAYTIYRCLHFDDKEKDMTVQFVAGAFYADESQSLKVKIEDNVRACVPKFTSNFVQK